jgi:hypothetical protein
MAAWAPAAWPASSPRAVRQTATNALDFVKASSPSDDACEEGGHRQVQGPSIVVAVDPSGFKLIIGETLVRSELEDEQPRQ